MEVVFLDTDYFPTVSKIYRPFQSRMVEHIVIRWGRKAISLRAARTKFQSLGASTADIYSLTVLEVSSPKSISLS